MIKNCLNCNQEFKTYHSEVAKGKGKYCTKQCSNTRKDKKPPWNKGKTGVYSKETIQLMKNNRKIYKGHEHKSWSAKPTYSGIHQWISRTLGKPMVCENCDFIDGNNRDYHWANLSGRYNRDVSDWARLCIWCHFAIDNTVTKGWKTKKGIN